MTTKSINQQRLKYLRIIKGRLEMPKSELINISAFRGFGGPQGMLFCENIFDQIADSLKIDGIKVNFFLFNRMQNFYKIIIIQGSRAEHVQ